MRILVSGFEPFGGEAINPTAELVTLMNEGEFFGALKCELRAVLLPVTFDQAFSVLEAAIRDFNPDIVLSLGQAGGRDAIEFERVAVNLIDSEAADNVGHVVRSRPVISGAREAYFSTLPLLELVDAVKREGIPARISNSAGLYVCNSVFYQLQHRTRFTKIISGFIHVPYLPEQAAPKAAPSMDLETMRRAVLVTVQCLNSKSFRTLS